MKQSYKLNFIFFVCLIGLIWIAYQRKSTSIQEGPSAQISKDQPIHELDPKILNAFEFAKNQASTGRDVAQAKHKLAYAARFKDILKQLNLLEKKYTSTSPGLALLGPFGTASTVLKEQDIEAELQELIKEIGRLVDDFDGIKDMPPESDSLETNLLDNQDELFENMLGN